MAGGLLIHQESLRQLLLNMLGREDRHLNLVVDDPAIGAIRIATDSLLDNEK